LHSVPAEAFEAPPERPPLFLSCNTVPMLQEMCSPDGPDPEGGADRYVESIIDALFFLTAGPPTPERLDGMIIDITERYELGGDRRALIEKMCVIEHSWKGD
jgi:hypothetical protein